MKLEQSFEVEAPLEQVWQALIDVERVAPCLPGAEVTGRNDDGSYNGSFKVKIGPTAAAYTGKLLMEEVDEEAHRATMNAQGTDRRGQGGAKATIVSAVSSAAAGATKVDVATDYHITGRLARFGRGGMIEEISHRLLNEFAKSLQQMLSAEPATRQSDEAAPDAPAPVDAPAPIIAEPTTGAAGLAAPGEGPGASADYLEAPAQESGDATADTLQAAADAVLAAGEPQHAPVEPREAAGQSRDAGGEPEDSPGDAAIAGAVPVSPASSPSPPDTGEATVEALSALGAEPEPSSTPSTPPPSSVVGASEPGSDSSSGSGSGPGSEPIQGLSLMGSVILSRVKQNPAPVVALVVGFLIAVRVLRRRG